MAAFPGASDAITTVPHDNASSTTVLKFPTSLESTSTFESLKRFATSELLTGPISSTCFPKPHSAIFFSIRWRFFCWGCSSCPTICSRALAPLASRYRLKPSIVISIPFSGPKQEATVRNLRECPHGSRFSPTKISTGLLGFASPVILLRQHQFQLPSPVSLCYCK